MSKGTQTPPASLCAQGSDETRRLKRQADFLSRFTHYLLAAAGIRAGMQVLDVGTGLGEVAFLVGSQGTVVGVDVNPALLEVARQRTQVAGITNVAFIQGDLFRVFVEAGLRETIILVCGLPHALSHIGRHA